MSDDGKVALGVVLILAVLAIFLFYTNPGKKLSAEIGIQDCVENQFTGHVSCGDDAERLENLRDRLLR